MYKKRITIFYYCFYGLIDGDFLFQEDVREFDFLPFGRIFGIKYLFSLWIHAYFQEWEDGNNLEGCTEINIESLKGQMSDKTRGSLC